MRSLGKCKSKSPCHFTPVRMTVLEKRRDNNFDKLVERREPMYTAGGNVNCAVIMENSMAIPQSKWSLQRNT